MVNRRVTVVEGEELAKKLGAAFVESSAKANKNVGKYAVWSTTKTTSKVDRSIRQSIRYPPPRNEEGV